MSDYFDVSGVPGQAAPGSSSVIRSEFAAVESGISDKLAPLSGNGDEVVKINAGATGMESITTAALGALLVTAGLFTVDDATNSGVSSPISLTHTTSGSPANGIGTGLPFITETSASNNETGAILESVTTDVTATSEDFDLVVQLLAAGAAAAEVGRFKSTGELSLTSGGFYAINSTSVLTATTLGTGVVNSSLTSVGTIGTGVWEGDVIAEAFLPNAGLAAQGVVELATVDETNTGTDAGRAVTPDGLDGWTGSAQIVTLGTIATGVWSGDIILEAKLENQSGTNTGDEIDASTSAKGVIELATQAEVDAGTGTNVAVTSATLVGAKLKVLSYRETNDSITPSTSPDVDCDLGNVFDTTLTTGTTTFTFSNPPTAGTAYAFTLIITQDSTQRSIVWPTSVDWDNGVAPDAPAVNDIAVYTFSTIDGGTIWYGTNAGLDFA